MARKIKPITISDEGRDKGKTFIIEEMPASQAEKWALRAIMAAVRAGIDVPEELKGAGMAAIAAVGIKALLSMTFDDLEPLLDEMFECVKIARVKEHPDQLFGLLEEDIEEVATRVLLRTEVLELHVGFSVAGTTSTSTSEPAPKESN